MRIPFTTEPQPGEIVMNHPLTNAPLLTTVGGHEGAANSHVVSTISADQGRTWSELVELEPTDGPPSVYSLPVVARSGRVYAFYDYNDYAGAE